MSQEYEGMDDHGTVRGVDPNDPHAAEEAARWVREVKAYERLTVLWDISQAQKDLQYLRRVESIQHHADIHRGRQILRHMETAL